MTFKYFKLEEFTCKCGCGGNKIDPVFVQKLDTLRGLYGKPLVVTSGYRCPDHNARVSATGRAGPHTTGHAADLAVARGDAYLLLKEALSLGFTGIGVQQKGGGRFLHLDDLPSAPGQPRPTVWSY